MMRSKMLGMAAATAAGLMLVTAAQAAPALDTALSAANAGDVTHVQYYGYGYRPYYGYGSGYGYGYRPYYGYGESPQHYAYRQAHRAYRAERYYRYGY